MKDYPSILRATGQHFREIQGAYCWDKLDGSNLRFEWSRKGGWYKFGTRTRLFDESSPIYGHAIPLFRETIAEPLEKIARDNRWEQLIAFAEFWGDRSFIGWRDVYDNEGDLSPEDTRYLTILDLAPYKKGILGPKEFLKLCEGKVPIPCLLKVGNWTRGYVEAIRQGEVEGITFEGVVAKAGEGHHQVRAKAKTQAWIDAVLAKLGEEAGRKIIES